jgi:hypothetical protein
MKSISNERKNLTLLIAYCDAGWIGVSVFDRSDDQSLPGSGMRDELTHRFQGGEGLGSLIEGDGGKKSMVDRVPCPGFWRNMTHRHAEPGLVRHVLHLTFPEAAPSSVGASSISRNDPFVLLGIHAFALWIPPTSDTLDGTCRWIVVGADVENAMVLKQVVNARGDRLPVSQRKGIVDMDRGFFSFGLPCSSVVLHGADLFLFLPVHRENRIARTLTRRALLMKVSEPGIPTCMRTSLTRFLVGTQRKAPFVQPLTDGSLAALMALLLQCFLQSSSTFRRPCSQAHQITFWFQQSFQVVLEADILFFPLFSPST